MTDKEKTIRERFNVRDSEEVPEYVLQHTALQQPQLSTTQIEWAKGVARNIEPAVIRRVK